MAHGQHGAEQRARRSRRPCVGGSSWRRRPIRRTATCPSLAHCALRCSLRRPVDRCADCQAKVSGHFDDPLRFPAILHARARPAARYRALTACTASARVRTAAQGFQQCAAPRPFGRVPSRREGRRRPMPAFHRRAHPPELIRRLIPPRRGPARLGRRRHSSWL